MSSPQKENGFTPIANELLEAFYRCKLLEYERCIIMCIWRKTYGWSKKEDWVSNSQIFEETGIALPNITRTLNSLKTKKIVIKNGRLVGVNKRYLEWQVEWRKVISPDNLVISPDNQKLSHQIPTKEKRNYTKEIGETSSTLLKLKDNNKEDMSWNKQSEDYEEGTINLDETLEVIPDKKPQTKKYPNALKIFKVFQEVSGRFPANWKINRTQLLAAENLYTERTLERVRVALQFYEENKDTEFCPKISSPYDLDSKWIKLGDFKQK